MGNEDLDRLCKLIETAQWRIGQANSQITALSSIADFVRVAAQVHSVLLPAIPDKTVSLKLASELRFLLDCADRIENICKH